METQQFSFYFIYHGPLLLCSSRIQLLAVLRDVHLVRGSAVAARPSLVPRRFVIIGLRPLGQFLCAIVEEQLQEALLVMPVMTAFDMTCGVITLSCDDFVDFMVRTPCVEVEVELELDVVVKTASS